jgi:hypothetical protein
MFFHLYTKDTQITTVYLFSFQLYTSVIKGCLLLIPTSAEYNEKKMEKSRLMNGNLQTSMFFMGDEVG